MTIEETNARLTALGLTNLDMGRLYAWVCQIQWHGWTGFDPQVLSPQARAAYPSLDAVRSVLERAGIDPFAVDFKTAPAGPPLCAVPGSIPGVELTEYEKGRPVYHDGRETCPTCGRHFCKAHLREHVCQAVQADA